MKKLYWDFHALFGKAHPNLSKSQCKDEADEKWKSMKKDKKTVDMDVYNREVGSLKSKLIKRKATMFDFALKKSKKETSPSISSSVDLDTNQNLSLAGPVLSPDDASTTTSDPPINIPDSDIGEDLTENLCESSQSGSEDDTVMEDGRRETPAQNKLRIELTNINSQL